MTSQLPALCWSCERLLPDKDQNGTPLISRCRAFPERIPVEIAWGSDHRQPRGDEVDDLVYKQKPDGKAYFEAWRTFHEVARH